ncbi:MAG: sigma factor-like helix-turn-helix DNA-binding protein [Phycisphaerales bacterium]|jgi:predicted DNA-binding protein YlxM (UPF0122 family)
MKQIHSNTPHKTLKAGNRHLDRLNLLQYRLDTMNERDRVLMKMYLEKGISIRQIARLLGVSEIQVGRKIRKLSKRLTSKKYIQCIRKRHRLTKFQMIVAKDFYMKGISIRRIALKQKTTRYFIRKTLKKIQSVLDDEQTT